MAPAGRAWYRRSNNGAGGSSADRRNRIAARAEEPPEWAEAPEARAGTAVPTGAHAMAPGSASPWWHRAAARAERRQYRPSSASTRSGCRTSIVSNVRTPSFAPRSLAQLHHPIPGSPQGAWPAGARPSTSPGSRILGVRPDNDCHLRAGLGCCICGAGNSGDGSRWARPVSKRFRPQSAHPTPLASIAAGASAKDPRLLHQPHLPGAARSLILIS